MEHADGATIPEPAHPGTIAVWLQASRAWTLGMPFMCVSVGTFAALYDAGAFSPWRYLMAAVAAMALQAGANMINDYYDFKSGTDSPDWQSPENFGPGLVIQLNLPHVTSDCCLLARQIDELMRINVLADAANLICVDLEDEAIFIFVIAAIEEFAAIRHLDHYRVAVAINAANFARQPAWKSFRCPTRHIEDLSFSFARTGEVRQVAGNEPGNLLRQIRKSGFDIAFGKRFPEIGYQLLVAFDAHDSSPFAAGKALDAIKVASVLAENILNRLVW
jgi:hypothetical protein